MKTPIRLALTVLAFLGVSAGAPRAQAFDQNFPEGDYPGNNTAEGALALWQTLRFYPQTTAPSFNNTALGFNALTANTSGNRNTATGAVALGKNITGGANTATGTEALYSNTTGGDNTANGDAALLQNTTGFKNTAIGAHALFHNTTAVQNTATGVDALVFNATGNSNTATGSTALFSNTSGFENTAIGARALFSNTTGSVNIALGRGAGQNLTTGHNNIDIGNEGVAAEANTIRIGDAAHTRTFIAGISGANIGKGVVVEVDASGQLGTRASSQRFKQEIKPMDKASEAILALKPVTFRYKKELDPDRTPQFGLVAEDVEKVNPDLVARDAKGKIYTVRYDAVNAMLLNEFLKEHRKVQDQEVTIGQLKSTVAKQEAMITQQQKGMETVAARLDQQAAQIQKVSAEIEVSKPASQTVLNQ